MVELSVGALPSKAANEGVWMKEFISDLGVIPSASGPMKSFMTILEQFP